MAPTYVKKRAVSTTALTREDDVFGSTQKTLAEDKVINLLALADVAFGPGRVVPDRCYITRKPVSQNTPYSMPVLLLSRPLIDPKLVC